MDLYDIALDHGHTFYAAAGAVRLEDFTDSNNVLALIQYKPNTFNKESTLKVKSVLVK